MNEGQSRQDGLLSIVYPVGVYTPYSGLMNEETGESNSKPLPSAVSLGVLAV